MASRISYKYGMVTSHSGMIIGGVVNTKVDGNQVATIGDIHMCPICEEDYCHGATIAIGTGFAKVEGEKVVRVGDICGCGAVVIIGSNSTSTE